MLISFAYRLTCKILSVVVILAGRDVSSESELLLLRHENTVLRRHVKRICHRTEDRSWFAALSTLVPRRRWVEVFPVTPGTMLAWHRRFAADKYTTTASTPGRQPACEPIRTLVIRMAVRNMLMDLGERATSFKFMIRDRGGQFTWSPPHAPLLARTMT